MENVLVYSTMPAYYTKFSTVFFAVYEAYSRAVYKKNFSKSPNV
jgi:hypothetical protein